jgi:flagellar basal-body rod modification protein FlgD
MITAPISSIMPSRSTGTTDASSASKSAGSASSAITNAAGGAMGKDEFVKLLITQMKNQDPMNPMDGKDLAAQLAQFSSVEQLININAKLDGLSTLLTPATVPAADSNSTTQGA